MRFLRHCCLLKLYESGDVITMISNLGYIVLGVSDLDAWERFAVDVVGLQVGAREAGVSLGLRMDSLNSVFCCSRIMPMT